MKPFAHTESGISMESSFVFVKVIECDLQGNCREVSKTLEDITDLKNEWNLPIRDMRIFFHSKNDHLPAILSRPSSQCFLVNLEHIKLLCKKDMCIILHADDEDVRRFVADLRKQLNQKHLHLASPEESSIHNFLDAVANKNDIKMEFAVLETTLSTVMHKFKNHLKLMKPILDILLQKTLTNPNTDMLRRMLAFMKNLNVFESSVKMVRSAVVEALKEEDDLVGLCLTKNGKKEAEEMELLLEAYDADLKEMECKLANMKEQIDDTNDFMNIHLSSIRNSFMKMSMLMELGTLVCGAGALITGIFGMNLHSGWEESHIAFSVTAGAILVGVVITGILFYRYVKRHIVLNDDFSCSSSVHAFAHLFNYINTVETSKEKIPLVKEEFQKVLEPVIGTQLTARKLDKIFRALFPERKHDMATEEGEKGIFHVFPLPKSFSSSSLFMKSSEFWAKNNSSTSLTTST